MKKSYRLNGLDCANCAAKMEREISKIDGIKSANISFMTTRMSLEADNEQAIQNAFAVIKKIEPQIKIEG